MRRNAGYLERQECVEPGCHFENDDYRGYCEMKGHAKERRAYTSADEALTYCVALKIINSEAIRDPTPHSSAWLIPAGAMDVVKAALANRRVESVR